MTREFVDRREEVIVNVRQFVEDAVADPDWAWGVLRSHTFFVFVDGVGFGPNKAVAYKSFDQQRYEDAKEGREYGARFNGNTARNRIEGVLETSYVRDDQLGLRLDEWAQVVDPEIWRGIRTDKWRFISITPENIEGDGPKKLQIRSYRRSSLSETVDVGDYSTMESPLAVTASDCSDDIDEWPHYEEAWEHHKNCWSTYYDVLVHLCSDHLGHRDLSATVAKVGIIARAYAAGLERHTDSSGTGAIVATARSLVDAHEEVDQIFTELKLVAGSTDALTASGLATVVDAHRRIADIVANTTRDGNLLRSFVSKYMHFHVQGVPIFDSRANGLLTRWYPLRGKRNWRFSQPDTLDYIYYQFCNRFFCLWLEAVQDGLDVSVRRLDQYLLYLDFIDG